MKGSGSERFPPEWWQRVLEAWNASGDTTALAGAGTVGFEVLDTANPPVWVRFDHTGKAAPVVAPQALTRASLLSATPAQWRAFIRGETTATMAVLTGRIRHRGSVSQLMPYGMAFDRLAVVAREIGAS